MKKKVVPELGAGGWVEDPIEQLNLLFGHMLSADYSQSNIYRGNVTSIQYLIANHQDDPTNLKSAVDAALTEYLGRYFDTVTVETYTGDDTEREYVLFISADVTRNGVTYSLSKAAKVDGGKIIEVTAEANR